jgi:TetR/AcrR family tetracycline transcriptional repressor
MRRNLTKDLIVAEAMKLIDEEGLEGLSMRKLAARLGVQAATLYYHVPDKSALMNDLMNVLFERCFEIMPEVDNWQDWMRAFGRAIWRVQAEVKAAPLLILTTQMDDEHFERSVKDLRVALAGFGAEREELMVIQSAVQAVVTGWSIFANSPYAEKMGRMFDFEDQAIRSVDSLVRGWEDTMTGKGDKM